MGPHVSVLLISETISVIDEISDSGPRVLINKISEFAKIDKNFGNSYLSIRLSDFCV